MMVYIPDHMIRILLIHHLCVCVCLCACACVCVWELEGGSRHRFFLFLDPILYKVTKNNLIQGILAYVFP